ncbi:MAG: nicotinate-nucleotide adenylyltransferase [Thermoguttaceae bacterium]|nr:nicotinate-nucleotide adenylyltransferase [Thermoguttaceae bacterium]
MRLGLYGGSFDPVHYGHLLLAECCREQAHLDQVLFLPAAVPPHKRDRVLTPAQQRIEMLELAVAGHEAFAVSRYEADRGGVSYTVQTLEHFRRQQPEVELFFLLGADMLNDLPDWYEARRVCELAMPLVVRRAGAADPDYDCLREIASPERIDQIRRHQVEMPAIGLSSTDLRRRVAAGASIRFRTPRAVEKYIESHGLYCAEHAAG